MSDADLVRMANQIAANLTYLGEEKAAASVAAHLRSFWAPPMRAELLALFAAGDSRLTPIVVLACRQLEVGVPATPPPAAAPPPSPRASS